MRTLKQTTKNIGQYPWARPITVDEQIGRAINRLRFKSRIWGNSNARFSDIYQMVNDVRFLSGLDLLTREQVEEGWQYRTIFADNYRYALSEFKALCWGDW